WHGHYEGDPVRYRPSDHESRQQASDPLATARAQLDDKAAGVVDAEVEAEMDGALAQARKDPVPEVDDLGSVLWAPHAKNGQPHLVEDREWRYMDAIKQATADALAADDRVRLAGI